MGSRLQAHVQASSSSSGTTPETSPKVSVTLLTLVRPLSVAAFLASSMM